MTRRTTPKSKTDDLLFPVRVKVLVPRNGFGNLIGEITHFMNTRFGPDRSARHSAQSPKGQACAFYFVDLESAAEFFEEYPLLDLADGTGRGLG